MNSLTCLDIPEANAASILDEARLPADLGNLT